MRSKILWKLILARAACDTPIARVTGCVPSLRYIDRRPPLELACTRISRVTLIDLCTETITPVFRVFLGGCYALVPYLSICLVLITVSHPFGAGCSDQIHDKGDGIHRIHRLRRCASSTKGIDHAVRLVVFAAVRTRNVFHYCPSKPALIRNCRCCKRRFCWSMFSLCKFQRDKSLPLRSPSNSCDLFELTHVSAIQINEEHVLCGFTILCEGVQYGMLRTSRRTPLSGCCWCALGRC